MISSFNSRLVSLFEGGKGNVQVLLRSYGRVRTNKKINGWISHEGGVRISCIPCGVCGLAALASSSA